MLHGHDPNGRNGALVTGPAPVVHVIDDDELVRQGLSRLLRSEGYDVRTFASATAFLEQQSEPSGPACIVLDLMMPGMNGLELHDKLRHLQPEVPVIFVSGQAGDSMTVQARRAGAAAFLDKPLDPDELLAVVASSIDRSLEPG